MSELEEAIGQLKKVLWKERWSFFRVVIFVWAFLAGATIEHYWPELLVVLW